MEATWETRHSELEVVTQLRMNVHLVVTASYCVQTNATLRSLGDPNSARELGYANCDTSMSVLVAPSFVLVIFNSFAVRPIGKSAQYQGQRRYHECVTVRSIAFKIRKPGIGTSPQVVLVGQNIAVTQHACRMQDVIKRRAAELMTNGNPRALRAA
eukprot:2204396-Amphidinium_carterae.1